VRNELWVHTAHLGTPLLILGSCSPLSQLLPTVAGAPLLVFLQLLTALLMPPANTLTRTATFSDSAPPLHFGGFRHTSPAFLSKAV
jgi:hypothetical protein